MDDEQRQLLHLGQNLFLKGQYADAERALARFAERNPNYADVQNMLGLIYHEQGQYLRAQRCFETALKVNPRYTEAALNLAVIYNDQGRYEDARNIHMAAQARVAESPDASTRICRERSPTSTPTSATSSPRPGTCATPSPNFAGR